MANISADVTALVQSWAENGLDRDQLSLFGSHLAGAPWDVKRWVGVAIQLRQLGHIDAALATYAAAVERFPTSHQIWGNRGILMRESGQDDEAEACLKRAVDLKPDYVHAMESLGLLYDYQHRTAEALSWYERAMAIDPNRVTVVNNAANCHRLLGHRAAALACYRRAVMVDPDFPNALFSFASFLFEEREFDEAEELIERFLIASPGDREALQLRTAIRRRPAVPIAPAMKQRFDRPWNLSLAASRKDIERDLASRPPGDERSVFLSYARYDSAHAAWVKQLARDLRELGFGIVLDVDYDLDVSELIALGLSCRNIVIVADRYYMESALLGRIPVTDPASPYPSLSFPAELESEQVVGEIFKISAVVWELARQVAERGQTDTTAMLPFMVASPDKFPHVPNLRIFVEGWRLDESQLILLNESSYRRIVTAYTSGGHCFSRYPIVDFSSPEAYASAVQRLAAILSDPHRVDDAPPPGVAYWRLSGGRMTTLRPDFTPSGEHGGLFTVFDDWEPDPGPLRPRFSQRI